MSTSKIATQLRDSSFQPHRQSQSALFSLPAELRLAIFTLALSCPPIPLTVIDLRSGDRKLSLVTPGVGGYDVLIIQSQRVLSLPLTCKRAYAETLPVLYSHNVFAIYDHEVFPIFARRLYAPWVQSLVFCWMRSKPPPIPVGRKRLGGFLSSSREKKDAWEDVWMDIASFEGLRRVCLEIYVPYLWTPEWQQREQELLSPLMRILRQGTSGELTLTWEKAVPEGNSAEDFLHDWIIKRKPWGGGPNKFQEL